LPRYHLFEFNDQAWCPFRDTGLDMLRMLLNRGGHYRSIIPHLRAGLQTTKTQSIVDLCSGGGGPWLSLTRELEAAGLTPEVVLTDLFPNPQAFAAAAAACPRLRFSLEPVDATAMPADLKGFRTLFTSFHHFPPTMARSILADAVRNRAGIGIFEFTYRIPRFLAVLLVLPAPVGIFLMMPLMFVLMPFVRPVRFWPLFFTYIVPILPLLMPLIVAWDGAVSCLRTYTVTEMLEMAHSGSSEDPARVDGYRWTAGTVPTRFYPYMPVSYLVGVPLEGPGSS
jgi:hypothetical protein